MSARDSAAATELAKAIADLQGQVEQVHRRMNNIFREAKVLEVKDDGTARVKAANLETGFVPWMEQGGATKTWSPLVAEERVLLVSPGGDPTKAFVMRGGFSNDFEQPSQDLEADVKTYGATKITQTATSIRFEVGSSFIELTAGGISGYADEYNWE